MDIDDLEKLAKDTIKSHQLNIKGITESTLIELMFDFAEKLVDLNTDLHIENEYLQCCGNCKKLFRDKLGDLWCFHCLNISDRKIEDNSNCKCWQFYKDETLDKTNPYELEEDPSQNGKNNF